LSWIALQFLSHCQKHLNRLLVAFISWKVLEEKIIGAYVNKELSQKTARKRRVWLKSATYLLRDTLQKEKFSLKKLLKKIKIISAHGVTLIEKQKLSKFYQGSLLKASFYPVQNSQLKGMINSTVIHSCSLCFNYCRWWLDLIRKKTLTIIKTINNQEELPKTQGMIKLKGIRIKEAIKINKAIKNSKEWSQWKEEGSKFRDSTFLVKILEVKAKASNKLTWCYNKTCLFTELLKPPDL